MSNQPQDECSQRELVEGLARGELTGERYAQAVRTLEQSEPCRELYRHLTAGHFPLMPDYTILEQVGKGGFGVVYKAIHHTKERVEALKVLFSKTPILTSYFQNEVHLIARLRHPNIATLYEAQLSTPPLYYTMEFVEGQRLNEYLGEHDVALAERIQILQTVARAVEYAHQQGVVHRDLKPQNILLDTDGVAHIVDFGIAKKLGLSHEADATLQEGERHEGPLGTVGYIAPEQATGGDVDARADIFALGALLFHCITGEPARHASEAPHVLELLRQRELNRPEDLAAIIARCVARSPEQRYPTCAALVADIDNFLAGRSISARETSLGSRATRLAGLVLRNHALAVRVALLACVATFLTVCFTALGARLAERYDVGGRTVVVKFTPSTLAAIGGGAIGADLDSLSVADKYSWRMLYGRLMEKLAAARPLVVVWDYYMPICRPEYDDAFVRGIKALGARGGVPNGTPVIVGARAFDLNGEPRLCPAIRSAVYTYGALHTGKPEFARGEFEVVHCIQRGFEDPIPSLAVAAFAAAQAPDSDLDLRLDTSARQLQLRYLKREPQAGEARYRTESVVIPLNKVAPWRRQRSDELKPDDLMDRDLIGRARIGIRGSEYWDERTLAFEDVLAAEPSTIRRWFDGKAVVLGKMIPGVDSYHLNDGAPIFGCQIQAETLDALLARAQLPPIAERTIALRAYIWCAFAAVLISVQKPRKWRSSRWVAATCSGTALAGIFIGLYAALHFTQAWQIELSFALSGLLTSGALMYWARVFRERQIQLAPSAERITTDSNTESTTVLADTL